MPFVSFDLQYAFFELNLVLCCWWAIAAFPEGPGQRLWALGIGSVAAAASAGLLVCCNLEYMRRTNTRTSAAAGALARAHGFASGLAGSAGVLGIAFGCLSRALQLQSELGFAVFIAAAVALYLVYGKQGALLSQAITLVSLLYAIMQGALQRQPPVGPCWLALAVMLFAGGSVVRGSVPSAGRLGPDDILHILYALAMVCFGMAVRS